MSKQDKINRLPLSAWQAERLRLTAFMTPDATLNNVDWWTELIGGPAETYIKQPSIGSQKDQGPFCGGTLINEVKLNRIDWLLIPPPQEIEIVSYPTIGPLLESLEPFVELMQRWLNLRTCPTLQRLAFGPILAFPVESRATGYRQLSAYLPHVDLDPDGSSDFLYQINRRRQSALNISGLEINRLSKWSVAALKGVIFTLEMQKAVDLTKGTDLLACHLELDINTAAEFPGTLTKKQLGLVFQELVDLAKEIITDGDIP